jgi:cytochrome oxidase Cu insertion factor (SCO1/SenC/PrrC family)
VPLLERLPQHWRDDQGRDTSIADFRGRWVVLTMAYTSCRLICPTTMARLQQLQRDLDSRGQFAEFVVIGYVPASDDPQAWRQYRRSRGLLRSNWHFLTGTPANTATLAGLLGFQYWKYDEHVMHEPRFVIVDERGALALQGGTQPLELLPALIDNPKFADQQSARSE